MQRVPRLGTSTTHRGKAQSESRLYCLLVGSVTLRVACDRACACICGRKQKLTICLLDSAHVLVDSKSPSHMAEGLSQSSSRNLAYEPQFRSSLRTVFLDRSRFRGLISMKGQKTTLSAEEHPNIAPVIVPIVAIQFKDHVPPEA